jgi:CheY-like chemotaxis protein
MTWFRNQSLKESERVHLEKEDIQFAREHPLRILIADDNYINRRVLCLFLKRLGYEVTSTENGRECLQAVIKGNYDLLLTDIDMPEMTGIECTNRIREAKIPLYITAISASAPFLTPEEYLKAGMDGFMPKPVDFTALKKELQKISLRLDAMKRAPAHRLMPGKFISEEARQAKRVLKNMALFPKTLSGT